MDDLREKTNNNKKEEEKKESSWEITAEHFHCV